MNVFNNALKHDIAEDIENAVLLYEEALRQENTPLDAYLNLSVLYWECTDFGFNAGWKLPLPLIHQAGQRYLTVLEEAENRFGYHPEIRFWNLYIDSMTFNTMTIDHECEALATQEGSTLTPYFLLYADSNGKNYKEQARQLLEECKANLTFKNRYIVSVIEGVAMRANTAAGIKGRDKRIL